LGFPAATAAPLAFVLLQSFVPPCVLFSDLLQNSKLASAWRVMREHANHRIEIADEDPI
jgi:hypothetical protein